ncbi:hypothetical protein D3C81_1818650 [compost metagenome]
MLRMHANLVGTAGHRATTHQCRKRVTLFYFKASFRRFTFAVHPHNALTALQNVFQQRCLHHFHMRLPLAAHQRQIVLLHALFAQLLVQRT